MKLANGRASLRQLMRGASPGVASLRLIRHWIEAAADDVPRRGDVGDVACGDRLHEDVADGGRFDRAGEDRALAGVRRHLTEEPVLRSAADDVDLIDALAGESFETAEDFAILQRKAFERAAYDRAMRRGRRLA